MDTREAVELAGKTRLKIQAYDAAEEEKKRQGQLAAIDQTGFNQMALQNRSGVQQQELETLKTNLAMPETQSRIGLMGAQAGNYSAAADETRQLTRPKMTYYQGLADQARAAAGHSVAETDKLNLANYDEQRLSHALPTEALAEGWYAKNPKVTNPFTAYGLQTTPGPQVPSAVPMPEQQPSLFSGQASTPRTDPFEYQSPVAGIKKIGGKFTDWLNREPARPTW